MAEDQIFLHVLPNIFFTFKLKAFIQPGKWSIRKSFKGLQNSWIHFFYALTLFSRKPEYLPHSFKQGSSENDDRSDVYDHSEFKVISNCCYNNCCRTHCGHFTCIPKFTWTYLNLPEYNLICQNMPEFTWTYRIYHILSEFILIYMILPEFTWIYLNLPKFTWIYLIWS